MAEKHLKKNVQHPSSSGKCKPKQPRFYLTPVRMAKIKNSGDCRCWGVCGKRGTLLHCWWDCELLQPFWKSFWWFLRKLDIDTRGSSNTSPGNISRRRSNW
jgi:hypothetical protein